MSDGEGDKADDAEVADAGVVLLLLLLKPQSISPLCYQVVPSVVGDV